jgi:hypothetical protein
LNYDLQESANMQPEWQVIITGIRALAKRCIGCYAICKNKTGYSNLDSDGDSDADVKDEIDTCSPMPPMLPTKVNELSQEEVPLPMIINGPMNQELLHDWNALKSAVHAGIMLSTIVAFQ